MLTVKRKTLGHCGADKCSRARVAGVVRADKSAGGRMLASLLASAHPCNGVSVHLERRAGSK